MVYSKRVKILPTHTVPTVSSGRLINSNVRYVQGVLSMIQIHWSYDFTMGFCWLWKSMKQIFAKETSEKNGKDTVWVVLQRLLRRGDSILLTHTLKLAFLRQQLMCKAKKWGRVSVSVSCCSGKNYLCQVSLWLCRRPKGDNLLPRKRNTVYELGKSR